MTPELQALARRAVACEGWRWMPGIAVVDPHGVRGYVVDIAPLPEAGAWAANRVGVSWLSAEELGRCLPDLSDPATLGCLLALVRESAEPHRAPGDWPMVCAYQSQSKKWGVGAWLNENGRATFAALVLPTYDIEAEALIAALGAAP